MGMSTETIKGQVSTSRRSFLSNSLLAAGGLVVGVPTLLSQTACAATGDSRENSKRNFAPDAFIQITPQNTVHFYMPRSEMGQGTYTGLTTIIAEELDVDPSTIEIHHVGAHDNYTNPEAGVQITGGSNSIRVHFEPLRQAAANARAAILNAASKQMALDIAQLTTSNAQVFAKGQGFNYGEFVTLAASQELPELAPLKSPADFKYMGKNRPRLDGLSKSTGTAEFGLDVDFPGLHRAVLVRCPVAGGSVKSVDSSTAKNMPGVKKVVTIYNGVAVVATSYWQAKQAAASLQIEWIKPEKLSSFSSDTGKKWFEDALNGQDLEDAHEEGEGAQGLEGAAKVISAEYWAPYLAHSTMEPLNCTVRIENEKCDVWVGSQSPGVVQGLAARISGLSKDDVTVHSTFLGGGFGRRVYSDNVSEACAIAVESGLAVQLIWSREDDTQHDYYRPASLASFKVGLDKDGNIQSWNVKRAGPNTMPYFLDQLVDGKAPGFMPDGLVDWLSKRGYGLFDGLAVDESSTEGLYEDYDSPHKHVQHVTVDPGLPVGFWRSVGHSFSGYFKESMMDEVAHAQAQDPLQYRLRHTKNSANLNAALTLCEQKSGWGKPLPSHHFHGVACHNSFLSSVAQVAQVSVQNNQIKVHKITCVVHCGFVVNPDIVEAQMKSGIIFALTAALYGEITLKNGEVQQSNFHDYAIMRMNDTPEIDVHIIPSDAPPTGVGEPGVPPVAAAVANAIFAATGKRLRSLPLSLT
jgi:isoquinoline 1-oxidoreductase beta subunit